MFLCNKEKFEEYEKTNKDLSLIIFKDGNRFEIPMDLLFEKTRENDYELIFSSFQRLWKYILFKRWNWFLFYSFVVGGKLLFCIVIGLLLLIGLYLVLRYWGIKYKLDNGISPSLVDNESVDDFLLLQNKK